MEIAVTVLIMLICLASEAFFSGSEIGVVGADRMKLRHDAAQGSRGAQLALQMLEKPEVLLSTTLVGTNISVVTNTTMVTYPATTPPMIFPIGASFGKMTRTPQLTS